MYKNRYLINANYHHPKHRLQSLEQFYNYLQLHHHRYSVLNVTLSYSDNHHHKHTNITKLLKYLRESIVVNGEKLPIHHVWKLEYRPNSQTSANKATGYHYHLFLIWNQDVLYSSSKVEQKLIKKWEKFGGEINKNSCYTSHSSTQSIYDKSQTVMRTEQDKVSGLFHHLSYLTKEDPNQCLPDNYYGEEFQTSQRIKSRLTSHSAIKVHNLTIKAENEVAPSSSYDFDDSDSLPF